MQNSILYFRKMFTLKIKISFFRQFLTSKNTVSKIFRNANFTEFLRIQSEISQIEHPIGWKLKTFWKTHFIEMKMFRVVPRNIFRNAKIEVTWGTVFLSREPRNGYLEGFMDIRDGGKSLKRIFLKKTDFGKMILWR